MKFLEPKRRLSEKDSRRFFGNFDNDLTIFLPVFMKKSIFVKNLNSLYGICMEKTEFFCGITIWKNKCYLCMMNTTDIKIG